MTEVVSWGIGRPDFSDTNITTPHRKIYDGRHFTACKLFTAIADGASAYMLLKTGSTRELHVTINSRVDNQSQLFFYEDTIISAVGTQITERNNNRQSTLTADMDVYYTPTVDDNGTQICGAYVPAGERKAVVGGEHATRTEWILKQNTYYLLRVENQEGAAAPENIGIKVEWYEV